MYKHEIVAGEVCGICVHYYQHYIFRHGKYSAIWYGHCRCPRPKRRTPEPTCSSWEPAKISRRKRPAAVDRCGAPYLIRSGLQFLRVVHIGELAGRPRLGEAEKFRVAPDDRAAPGISGEGHQLWKESLGEEDRIAPPALPREGMNEIGRFQKGIYQVFNTFCCQIWLIADRKQDSVHIPQGGEAQPDTRRHPLPGVAIEEGKVAQLSRLGQYLAILAGDHRLCKEGGGRAAKARR